MGNEIHFWAGSPGTPDRPLNQLDCTLVETPMGTHVRVLGWPEMLIKASVEETKVWLNGIAGDMQ